MDVQQWNVTKAAVDASNPIGAWAGAPTLAASTVAMSNTSGYTVMVDIYGGTVTSIKVNGTATGYDSGTVRLLPGDSLAITYSVAPTLAWSFDAVSPTPPWGSWSGAPSLASSTVAMFNTSGAPVTVCVSAGTVTVIAIDGVTTGLTSGSFRLRRGASIAITYSVAPTLHWLYS